MQSTTEIQSTYSTINSVEKFLQHLSVPKACVLNKPLYKKMFLENGKLDATDKICLKDDVDKVIWLYTLKPSTINVSAYVDDKVEYTEIALLLVELSSPKRSKRIANFMQRSISYPLVIVFSCLQEDNETLLISLADKRINQADKEKWVVEDSFQTQWINLTNANESEIAFLNSCEIKTFSYTHFLSFYKSFMARVVALNCANHTGVFMLESNSGIDGNNSDESRLSRLREVENLNLQKAEIANLLKKETQIAKQITLNTEIKHINDKIENLKKFI